VANTADDGVMAKGSYFRLVVEVEGADSLSLKENIRPVREGIIGL
jgi:hypothetical protein